MGKVGPQVWYHCRPKDHLRSVVEGLHVARWLCWQSEDLSHWVRFDYSTDRWPNDPNISLVINKRVVGPTISGVIGPICLIKYNIT
ncbi:hypothetical protein J6590_059459 [Homalodisca vitripennis]|nr:hypothetical protein J6590_059459 [Homalodisca vitripennis]